MFLIYTTITSNYKFHWLSLFQVEPQEMSMYREEAIDILIETLRRKEFSDSQMTALDALISLSGRLTSSGKSYTKA